MCQRKLFCHTNNWNPARLTLNNVTTVTVNHSGYMIGLESVGRKERKKCSRNLHGKGYRRLLVAQDCGTWWFFPLSTSPTVRVVFVHTVVRYLRVYPVLARSFSKLLQPCCCISGLWGWGWRGVGSRSQVRIAKGPLAEVYLFTFPTRPCPQLLENNLMLIAEAP